jgi:hypothetical protein
MYRNGRKVDCDCPYSLDYKLEYEDGHELIVELQYNVSDYIPAQLGGPPEHCHPSEGGEVTKLVVLDEEGTEVVLTADEEEAIDYHIYANHEYD